MTDIDKEEIIINLPLGENYEYYILISKNKSYYLGFKNKNTYKINRRINLKQNICNQCIIRKNTVKIIKDIYSKINIYSINLIYEVIKNITEENKDELIEININKCKKHYIYKLKEELGIVYLENNIYLYLKENKTKNKIRALNISYINDEEELYLDLYINKLSLLYRNVNKYKEDILKNVLNDAYNINNIKFFIVDLNLNILNYNIFNIDNFSRRKFNVHHSLKDIDFFKQLKIAERLNILLIDTNKKIVEFINKEVDKEKEKLCEFIFNTELVNECKLTKIFKDRKKNNLDLELNKFIKADPYILNIIERQYKKSKNEKENILTKHYLIPVIVKDIYFFYNIIGKFIYCLKLIENNLVTLEQKQSIDKYNKINPKNKIEPKKYFLPYLIGNVSSRGVVCLGKIEIFNDNINLNRLENLMFNSIFNLENEQLPLIIYKDQIDKEKEELNNLYKVFKQDIPSITDNIEESYLMYPNLTLYPFKKKEHIPKKIYIENYKFIKIPQPNDKSIYQINFDYDYLKNELSNLRIIYEDKSVWKVENIEEVINA